MTQALGLAVKALAASGIREIALENPCHPDLRRLVASAGATPVAVRVDEHGLIVGDLANSRARAVIAFYPMSQYWRDRRPVGDRALVFGYGHLTEHEIEDGLKEAFSR
jgi:DNA-binding transcriptional MocR family regulator